MRRHPRAGGPVQLALTISVLALFAAAIAFAVSGCAVVTPEKAVAAGHPAVASDTPCTSCKAPLHSFEHRDPYKGDCRTCHNTESWIRVSYSHATVAFDQGMHAAVGCSYCHTEQNPNPSPSCTGCHESKHVVVAECANCHQAVAWRLPKPLPTGHLSLAGGHKGVKCFECHSGDKPFSHPNGCASCHGPSKHGGLTNCASCHDPSLQWKPKKNFDHNQFFVLSGQHKSVKCIQCHPNNDFAAATPRCSSCHGAKHGGLTNCSACHTTTGFSQTTFQHSSVFRLTGRHTSVACSKCHPQNRFATAIGNQDSCVSCHGTRHGGLSKCAACHTTAGFKPSTFRHSSAWTLTGAHKKLACTKCHRGRKFANAIGNPKSCVSCHGTHHGGLSKCADCHTTSTFRPSTFKHSSAWTLTGAHKKLACTKCHPDRKYGKVIGSPSSCGNCHGVKHGNQTRCDQCHTTSTFSPAKSITHPGTIRLGPAHASRPCTLCHPNVVFNATKPCSDCHQAPHVGPTNCIQCHRPTVWSDTTKFQHADIGYHTQFPIEQACLKCHTTGNYAVYRCDHCHPAVPYP